VSDVFSWLRGCHAGRLTGNAAYAHPVQVRLWPLALDVIEAAGVRDRCPLCRAAHAVSAGHITVVNKLGAPHVDGCPVAAFFAAAEKERP